MKRDWVVWTGCILLFVAGLVWGQIRIKTDFFLVDNVHDMFEIFASIATVIAVSLALIGVNAWRQQLTAQADHELALRLVGATVRYKETVNLTFLDAEFAVVKYMSSLEPLPDFVAKAIKEKFEASLEVGRRSRSEFRSIVQEAKAIWGSEFSKEYDALLDFSEHCHACLRAYCFYMDFHKDLFSSDAHMRTIQYYADYFVRDNWLEVSGASMGKIDELTQVADTQLQGKLLRSR